MAAKEKENSTPVARTSAGLRDALFDELDALREGRSNAAKANATAKLCATVIETVRMEIEARKYLTGKPSESPELKSLGAPISLAQAA